MKTFYNIKSPIGQEPIKMDGSWAYFGKSKIMLDAWDFREGRHLIQFRIVAK